MTEQRIAEAQARLDATSPGPWTAVEVQVGQWSIERSARDGDPLPVAYLEVTSEVADGDDDTQTPVEADACFIAHAPDDLRDALAALRRVREVQRYDVYQDGSGDGASPSSDRDPDGEYVRWDDLVVALDGEVTK